MDNMVNNDWVPEKKKNNKSHRIDKSCYCDWENLPDGPLIEIAETLPSFEDFLALHLICTTWTSVLRVSKCKFLRGRGALCAGTPQIPWLMLSEHEDVNIDDQCAAGSSKEGECRGKAIRLFFYSLSSKRICNLVIRLPIEFGNYDFKDCHCYSSNGWFFILRNFSDMSLYSPFCSPPHNYIPLPGPESLDLDSGYKTLNVLRFVVSTSPSTKSFTVMIYYAKGRVAMWRTGDKCWTSLVKCPEGFVQSKSKKFRYSGFMDLTFYGGHFYAMTICGEIIRFELRVLTDDQYIEWRFVARLYDRKLHRYLRYFWSGYLVVPPNGEGKMLAVVREPRLTECPHLTDHRNVTDGFQVMEFNVDVFERMPYQIAKVVKSLGNKSLFVGDGQSLCFELGSSPKNSFYGLKPNCIYFTWCNKTFLHSAAFSSGKGKDLGVYNMADSTFDRHFQGLSLTHFSPRMWVEPRS